MESLIHAKMFVMYLLIVVCMFVSPVIGNGRLIEPVMRSSVWRFNKLADINYNDHVLDCGGTQIQYRLNRGRCGVCGDPYSGARDNEDGGRYAKGFVARRYRSGAKVTMVVDLVAPKGGYFEIKLCPREDPNMVVTQACFDNFPLKIRNGQGTRLWVKGNRQKDHGLYKLEVKLPPGISCTHCVIQWHYRTENSWGANPNGGTCLGCGAQTDFYNCADVTIGYYGDQEASPNQPNDLSLGPLASRINTYRNGAYGTGVSSVVVNTGPSQSGFVDLDDFDDDDKFRPNHRRQKSGFANLGFSGLFAGLFGGDDDDGFNFGSLLGGDFDDDDFGGYRGGRGQAQNRLGRQNRGPLYDDDEREDDNYYKQKSLTSLSSQANPYGKKNKVFKYDDDDDDDDDDEDDYGNTFRRKQKQDLNRLLNGLNDIVVKKKAQDRKNLLNDLNDLALDIQNKKNSIAYNDNTGAGGYVEDIPDFFKEVDEDEDDDDHEPYDDDDHDDDHNGYDDDVKNSPTYTTKKDDYEDKPTYTVNKNKDGYSDTNIKNNGYEQENSDVFKDNKNDYHGTPDDKYDHHGNDETETYKPRAETYDDTHYPDKDGYYPTTEAPLVSYDQLPTTVKPSTYRTPKSKTILTDSGGVHDGEGYDHPKTSSDYKTEDLYHEDKQAVDDGYAKEKNNYDDITSGANAKPSGSNGYTDDNSVYDDGYSEEKNSYNDITSGANAKPSGSNGYTDDNSVYDDGYSEEKNSYNDITSGANAKPSGSNGYTDDNSVYDDGYSEEKNSYNDITSGANSNSKEGNGYIKDNSVYDKTSSDDGYKDNIGDAKYAKPVYVSNQRGSSSKPITESKDNGNKEKDVIRSRPRFRQRFDITNGFHPPVGPLPHFGFGLHTNPLLAGVSHPAYPNAGLSAFQASPILSPLGTPTTNNLLPTAVNPVPFQNIPTNQHAPSAAGAGLFSWMPDVASISNYGASKSPLFGSQAANQYLAPALALQKSHPVTLCPRPEQLLCIATPKYRHLHNADAICTDKCRKGEACGEKYCACACQRRAHCVHQTSLQRLGQAAWKGVANNDDIWCTNQCNSGHCPNNICACNVQV